MELRSTIDCGPILRVFGAEVGANTVVNGPLHIMNADGDFSKLNIGHDVYVGTETLIDLADAVMVRDFATVSARCNLITHIDVGPGPLRERRPPKHAPVVIESGAYLGVGVTLLHGVTVGEQATIGAHCLVRNSVEAGTTWVSPEPRAPVGSVAGPFSRLHQRADMRPG